LIRDQILIYVITTIRIDNNW